MVVLGCDATLALGEPVRLLPGYPYTPGETRGCYTLNFTGSLVVDPQYGTAIITDDVGAQGHRNIAVWPDGYTARRAGAEVAVLDEKGQVVAVTGRRYRFEPADLRHRAGTAEDDPAPAGTDDPRPVTRPGFAVCVPLGQA